MAKPAWLKRALAAYAAALFAFDTGSDSYVGVDLYDRCHYRYSASVLFFAGLPGLLTGGFFMNKFRKFVEKKCGCDTSTCGKAFAYILGTLVGPFMFIPVTFGYLVYAIFNIDGSGGIKGHYGVEGESKLIKGLEMVAESFPQFVINLFMIQALQLSEPLNIFSCTISAISVLYGLGDFLAMGRQSLVQTDYDFSTTVYASLSIVVDTMLRSFTLAYWLTISKAYVIIVPFVYFLLMSIVLFFTSPMDNFNRDIMNSKQVLFFSVLSLGCSAYEYHANDCTIKMRPVSKGIFSAIFIAFAIFYGISAAPKTFNTNDDIAVVNNSLSNYNFEPSQCSNFCQGNKSDAEQEAFEGFCNNLWENINPDSYIHETISIVIGILFVLSILEGILESCCKWMPYRKLYEGTLNEWK